MRIWETLRTPVFASLMKNRTAAIAVSAFGAAQAAMLLVGGPAWQCSLRTTIGVPCPGCGLSRAVVLFLRGEWPAALEMHAYGPVLVFSLLLLFLAAVLRGGPRTRLIAAVESVERRTALSGILLVGLVIYWLVRLLFNSASIAFAVPR
ncbi:MAG: DUF2752 domain-containing protein [Blastocatellia bacterium]|nr:DUF2752 domain-containing protein [Blastocatellia bacterium]